MDEGSRVPPYDTPRVTPYDTPRVTPYDTPRVTPYDTPRVTPYDTPRVGYKRHSLCEIIFPLQPADMLHADLISQRAIQVLIGLEILEPTLLLCTP